MSDNAVNLVNANGTHPIVFVCEHASAFIPDEFNQLGLDAAALSSHIAWDPGASQVAHHLANDFDAPLVESLVSRLLYDCNRPPHSATAMPMRSEIYDIPGNKDLSDAARKRRIQQFYEPFERALAKTLIEHKAKQPSKNAVSPIIITMHSFTPTYNGATRNVEIGVLHDSDERLANAMLGCSDNSFNVQRNEPYGPADGVTHTLVHHGVHNNLLNVMLEIRNDLIATPASQRAMADHLHSWISNALTILNIENNPQPSRVV